MISLPHRIFSVTGMSCAACSARVEKAVSKVPGVSSCAVSLLTNSMRVEGEATDEAVIQAVEEAGYGAAKGGHAEPQTAPGPSPADAGQPERAAAAEAQTLRTRLVSSIILLTVLMYWSMGHMMLGWPLPRWFTEPEPNHVAMGLVQLLLAGAVLVINKRFFTNGFRGLLRGAPNMDTLVALGSGAAFAWSTVVLFLMTRAQVLEGVAGAEKWMGQYYFESAAMIVTLITVGKLLEAPGPPPPQGGRGSRHPPRRPHETTRPPDPLPRRRASKSDRVSGVKRCHSERGSAWSLILRARQF